jgi:hypothetical protein
MFTIFFNSTKEYKIAILPEERNMNSTYFIECVLRPLTEICYPQGRGHMKGGSYNILMMRLFTTLGVQDSLANFGFRRMEHPPYRPDLASCDSFLFGAMKQPLAGQHF